jgi:ATP phosphoribosyltransferase regulatory subunit
MRDNRLHTPDGFRDWLPGAYRFKLGVRRKIEDTFESFGYAPVSSPMLEYMEVFDGIGSTPPKQMYRFIDRDGDILTLRSDMTPSIARIAATNYTLADAPLRFFYTENAFRCHESYKGKAGEFTESGVELIGAGGPDADAEVIALAVKALLAAGLSTFRVYMGHARFFKQVLEAAGLSDLDCRQACAYMAEQNIAAAEKFLSQHKLPEAAARLCGRINTLTGGMGMLAEIKQMDLGGTARESIDYLERVYAILDGYGVAKYVLFDLSMVGTLGYYTGILFRGYTYGTGFSLLDGGRYDRLISQYGTDFPAVGCAIKLDTLAAVLSGNSGTPPADVLLAYTEGGRLSALRAADYLRAKGLRVAACLNTGITEEECVGKARRDGIPKLLYVMDERSALSVDIVRGQSGHISMSALLNGGDL